MILRAQYQDPESWAANKGQSGLALSFGTHMLTLQGHPHIVILTALGTFTAAVVAISQFGDLFVPQF